MTHYSEVATQLYGSEISVQGESQKEIAQAEHRLGIPLPRVLREYYHFADRKTLFNCAHNTLIAPQNLIFENAPEEILIFYTENQGVVDWEIRKEDFQQDDPPVYQGRVDDDWYLETSSLNNFLVTMLCWQGVMGALPYRGTLENSEGSLQEIANRIEQNWLEIQQQEQIGDLKIFLNRGQVICVSGNFNAIFIAARTQSHFRAIQQILPEIELFEL
ncbi:hypothetical protein IQ249_01750 [Lusitaniella coriacea LEGE 07157]|uniref:Knr4/Smi1-like domain-containing protein n=1 Tax=Lusitaniella coriacea LEGE 07157 TaxID=945747 RepID=A0A8J7B7S6_9CYAN|nr:hypothetical protein [Lusitaniella coriacea]MBE9114610.1 hypothetical protein [Lusitaniella coriacea LEGE 07157]